MMMIILTLTIVWTNLAEMGNKSVKESQVLTVASVKVKQLFTLTNGFVV